MFETRRFQAMGQLDSTCTAPPRPAAAAAAAEAQPVRRAAAGRLPGSRPPPSGRRARQRSLRVLRAQFAHQSLGVGVLHHSRTGWQVSYITPGCQVGYMETVVLAAVIKR